MTERTIMLQLIRNWIEGEKFMYRYIKSSSEDKFADMTKRQRRNYASRKSRIHKEDLWVLAKDEDGETRFNVALNPNVTPEILLYLADDSDYEVLRAVAARCTYSDMLNNGFEDIARKITTTHRHLPYDVLVYFLLEQVPTPSDVLDNIARNYYICLMNEHMFTDIIDHPNTQPETLAYIYDTVVEKDPECRYTTTKAIKRHIAKNPNTPAWILMLLSGDNDLDINDAANTTLS